MNDEGSICSASPRYEGKLQLTNIYLLPDQPIHGHNPLHDLHYKIS